MKEQNDNSNTFYSFIIVAQNDIAANRLTDLCIIFAPRFIWYIEFLPESSSRKLKGTKDYDDELKTKKMTKVDIKYKY